MIPLKISLLVVFTVLTLNGLGCTSVYNNDLEGTSWKLVGVVDNESGLKELEPKDCKKCYTLIFESGYQLSHGETVNLSGWTSTNEFCGRYNEEKTEHGTYSISITIVFTTEVGELGDGYLYCESFETIKSYARRGNILKLYYNGNKNYLLFRSL